MNQQLDTYLWGKSEPYKSLRAHMIDAGACCAAYLSSASMAGMLGKLADLLGCSREDAVRFCAYLTSLHDIGKAFPYFVSSCPSIYNLIPSELRARYFPPSEGLRFRHETESGWAVKRIWKDAGLFDRRTRDTLSAVLKLHHQGKRADAGIDQTPPAWEAVQNRLEARMRAVFCPDLPVLKVSHQDALGVSLTGLVILCDWAASSQAFDDLPDAGGDAAYFKLARARAEETLRSFGLTEETLFPKVDRFSDLWPEISASRMRPVQTACAEVAARRALLTIIEAPMGEGKSEAALYMAEVLRAEGNLRGIYMALPTAATGNQMYERVRGMLGGIPGAHHVRLLHSLAWMYDAQAPKENDFHLDRSDDGDAHYAAQWLAPLRKGLLSENAVGTVDQAMAAVVFQKYGLLRLTGLMGKVLIIDEIHAYDAYMSEIIERLLFWCRALKIPVILLSATLQKSQKERYLACFGAGAETVLSNAYPLVTQVDPDGQIVQTPVNGVYMKTRFLFGVLPAMEDARAIARHAVRRVENGGCLCVLLNTVDKAQAVYRAIKAEGFQDVMLFHARFLSGRRRQIEKTCVRRFGKNAGERPERAILVCTQVVEQSLDVDFDGMMTELAPVDLLIQRAGRVHRHRWRTRPSGFTEPLIEVLTPGDSDTPLEKRYGKTGYVYDPYILSRTEQLLPEMAKFWVPEDVRPRIDWVYDGLSDDRVEAYVKWMTEKDVQEIAADAVLFPPPRADRFFAAASAAAAGKFSRPDEDAEFRIVRGAKTRWQSDSVRVAFLDDALFEAVQMESVSAECVRKIYENICSIQLHIIERCGKITREEVSKRIKLSDNKNMNLSRLNGCLPVRVTGGIARIGQMTLHVDDELGIWMEVGASCTQ